MNRTELAKAVSDKIGLQEKQVKSVLDALTDEIVLAVRSGTDVRISDFGTFKRKAVAARTAKNPNTGAIVNVPARNRLAFKPYSGVAQSLG